MWWEHALLYIKTKSDYKLSKEMNWISLEIKAAKGFEVLEQVASEIAESLDSDLNDLLS